MDIITQLDKVYEALSDRYGEKAIEILTHIDNIQNLIEEIETDE